MQKNNALKSISQEDQVLGYGRPWGPNYSSEYISPCIKYNVFHRLQL